MFKQFKNIDSAFKHIRLFSIALIAATCIICCYNIFKTTQAIRESQDRVYFIANGKLLDAVAIDKDEVLTVQIQNHIATFHSYFFSLEPDDAFIKKNITKAFYLSDNSAKSEYDNLSESGYYYGIVSGNISQRLEMDSIKLNTDKEPYLFTYYGKLKIIRPTSIVTRSLITQGQARTGRVSTNNPQGFIIERWKIIENKDLLIEKR